MPDAHYACSSGSARGLDALDVPVHRLQHVVGRCLAGGDRRRARDRMRRAGRLEAVLPDFPPEPAVLAVLYPHRRLLPAKVKAFADFMVEHGPPALAGLDRSG